MDFLLDPVGDAASGAPDSAFVRIDCALSPEGNLRDGLPGHYAFAWADALADSKAELYAAECMTLDAARKRDEGLNVTTEASCSKMFASEMCGRVADRAVQILGGAGYLSEYGIERFYRDVRLFRLYEGTTQIQQIIIARNMAREVRG